MNELQGRDVLVIGLGISGFAVARALAGMGASVTVTERDSNPVLEDRAAALRALGATVHIGGHGAAGTAFDLAVVSPGVAPAAAIVQDLRAAGVRLIGEVELAYRLASCRFVAVTGTNGKTTTTALIAVMLAEGGVATVAGGNIGLPLIDAITMVPPDGVIALEVSSFQLEGIETFAPDVAVLLNVAEDHIDWHGSFDSYVRAKARIAENQGAEDVFVYNAVDPHAVAIAGDTRARVVPFSADEVPAGGVGVEGGAIRRGRDVIVPLADVPLSGRGGIEDAVAAAAAALELGIDAAAVARAIHSFRPLPHRLQFVADVDGVSYIDDSKATNPHAALAAVRGLTDIVLIAGGRSKGIDLAPMRSMAPPVVAVVALGEAAGEIEKVFEHSVPVERAASMQEAVRVARKLAVPGGSVLLSPGCASLDMYESYEARGDDFARAVRELATSEVEEE